jgi:hypothetical protein
MSEVLGLEIDPARVRTAREQLERTREGDGHFPADLPVGFGLGGFEVPDAGRTPARDHPAPSTCCASTTSRRSADAWQRMAARLAPGGLLVEGHVRRARPGRELGRRDSVGPAQPSP